MLACREKGCLEECVPKLQIDLTINRQKNSPPTQGFPGPAMFSVDTQHGSNSWPSLTFTKYCAMTVDLRRTVVDQLGYETIEILHNITVIYEQSGPRFIDNSESDARIDYARFGALMFTKVQQTYLSNIELNVGSTHKTRVGACTCVYSPKGKLLKRKKAKAVKVKKDERRYTIYRADETDSDSADEDYMCASE